MASIKSAIDSINEARGDLLTLLQENDTGEGGFATPVWSDEIYQASVCLRDALDHIDNAELSL